MNLSFRHFYWRWLKNLIFLFLIFVLFMSFARLGFTLYFGDVKALLASAQELKKAFFLGFRFDLMPLAYINAIPFLILNFSYFLTGKKKIRISRFLIISSLYLGHVALIWLYIFDYGFYSYFQEHLNILFFGFFEDDTVALLISIYKNYSFTLWFIFLVTIHYGLYRFIKFLFSPYEFDLKVKSFSWKYPVSFLAGLVLIAFMARGNFTRLPLSVEDAFLSDNEFINEIALNGALTLNRAIKIRKTFGKGQYDYLKNNGFESPAGAYEAMTGKKFSGDLMRDLTARTRVNPYAKENPPHVVLLVMESFGTYWNDSSSKDFQILGSLKKHFRKGLLFKNFLPAENGTIGSIVSVTTSQVIRPGARFLSESEFMGVPMSSSGNIPFKESGYETHFVYGGKLGWRDLGKFLAVQKFDRLWGADEIREAMPELNNLAEKDLGNEWGIFDEYLYSFIDERLRTSTKPQLFVVLTTSNHPPFEYPSSYKTHPLKFNDEILSHLTVDEELARKRFMGMQYANQKAGDFLNRITRSPLIDNTIVGITGDHSYWIAKGVGQEEEFKRYAVPFFLSIPEKYRPEKIDLSKFGSHEDIFPTLYNLALSDQTYIKLGEDLFGDDSFAINSSGLMANEKGAYHHGKFWRWKNLKDQILEHVEENEELLKLKRRGQGQISVTDLYLKAEKKNKLPDVKSGRP